MGRTPLPVDDALELIADSTAAAFGMDRKDRIVYWNGGATKALGWSADELLGRNCFDVLAGQDLFGNRYCVRNCPMTWAARHDEPLKPFVMDVRRKDLGEARIVVRTAALPVPGPAFVCLIHFIETGEGGRLDRLLEALRAPKRPETHLPPSDPPVSASPLTRRERDIVFLISSGYSTLNIAALRNLSHATVRNHVQNILRKLEVHSQVEAVALCFRRHWL